MNSFHFSPKPKALKLFACLSTTELLCTSPTSRNVASDESMCGSVQGYAYRSSLCRASIVSCWSQKAQTYCSPTTLPIHTLPTARLPALPDCFLNNCPIAFFHKCLTTIVYSPAVTSRVQTAVAVLRDRDTHAIETVFRPLGIFTVIFKISSRPIGGNLMGKTNTRPKALRYRGCQTSKSSRGRITDVLCLALLIGWP